MHRVLANTINGLLSIQEIDQLRDILEMATASLGFKYFAIGHHVNLAGPPVDALGIANYPEAWADEALTRRYFDNDPIHRASIHTATGFRWTQVADMIRLSSRDDEILRAAATHGLGDGYTVPVHVPGEYRGTCSFSGPSLDQLGADVLPIATTIGAYAFEAGRKILQRGAPADLREIPSLTNRQRDALVLVARGKADPEIGALLGISRATAHEHVENVRRAYGNPQRTFLIARALFDGQISFAEIFRR